MTSKRRSLDGQRGKRGEHNGQERAEKGVGSQHTIISAVCHNFCRTSGWGGGKEREGKSMECLQCVRPINDQVLFWKKSPIKIGPFYKRDEHISVISGGPLRQHQIFLAIFASPA